MLLLLQLLNRLQHFLDVPLHFYLGPHLDDRAFRVDEKCRAFNAHDSRPYIFFSTQTPYASAT